MGLSQMIGFCLDRLLTFQTRKKRVNHKYFFLKEVIGSLRVSLGTVFILSQGGNFFGLVKTPNFLKKKKKKLPVSWKGISAPSRAT